MVVLVEEPPSLLKPYLLNKILFPIKIIYILGKGLFFFNCLSSTVPKPLSGRYKQ